jgi:MutS domain V
MELFQQRAAQFEAQAADLWRQDRQWATARIAFFVALLVAGVWLANARQAGAIGWTLLLGVPLFLVMVQKHAQVRARRLHASRLAQLNRDELSRFNGTWPQLPGHGAAFVDHAHPYTSDLDVFGRNSLFQYLSRAVTEMGQTTLAEWLRRMASPAEIAARHSALTELAPLLDWRQDFAAAGLAYPLPTAPGAGLAKWAAAPPRLTQARWLPGLTGGLGWLTPVAIVAAFAWEAAVPVAVALGLANLLLIRHTQAQVKALLEQTEAHLPTLRAAGELLQRMDQLAAATPLLQQLQAQLRTTGSGTLSAGRAIAQLANIVEHIERRNNAYFYLLFVVPTLWDLRWAIRLERWRATYGPHLTDWLTALGQMEALTSLAGLHFAQPEFTLPQVTPELGVFEAEALGHPLVAANKRVTNSVALAGAGVCYLITGSNMAGKSTFLRTVGLNWVLAGAGAPVCAQSLVCSPTHLFTSMRTQDSLSESVSSFYAELRRIRQLLDLAQPGGPVFYFLDEILKGTNSVDRHQGAKALVRQLQQIGATGLVSTHDLELAALAEETPGRVINYHFSSEVVAGQLYFPYQLRPGVCQSFNASLLMQQLGIGLAPI